MNMKQRDMLDFCYSGHISTCKIYNYISIFYIRGAGDKVHKSMSCPPSIV